MGHLYHYAPSASSAIYTIPPRRSNCFHSSRVQSLIGFAGGRLGGFGLGRGLGITDVPHWHGQPHQLKWL